MRKNWQVHLKVNGNRMYFGTFSDEVVAAKVYNEAATKYFGEFARLNEIDD